MFNGSSCFSFRDWRWFWTKLNLKLSWKMKNKLKDVSRTKHDSIFCQQTSGVVQQLKNLDRWNLNVFVRPQLETPQVCSRERQVTRTERCSGRQQEAGERETFGQWLTAETCGSRVQACVRAEMTPERTAPIVKTIRCTWTFLWKQHSQKELMFHRTHPKHTHARARTHTPCSRKLMCQRGMKTFLNKWGFFYVD